MTEFSRGLQSGCGSVLGGLLGLTAGLFLVSLFTILVMGTCTGIILEKSSDEAIREAELRCGICGLYREVCWCLDENDQQTTEESDRPSEI